MFKNIFNKQSKKQQTEELKLETEELTDAPQDDFEPEYWAEVERAIEALCNYYGTGSTVFKAAYMDLARSERSNAEEILKEARKKNLI